MGHGRDYSHVPMTQTPGPPNGNQGDGNTPLQAAERTRNFFPETWLWLDDQIGYDSIYGVSNIANNSNASA